MLLTDFLQIVERLCAKEFDVTQLSVLEVLLDTFFSDFLKQFPDQALIPKTHFLQHYPKKLLNNLRP